MWNETQFEQYLKDRLTTELGPATASSMFAQFATARDKVVLEIRQIAAVEPNLSDHGPDHIADVFSNAIALISKDQAVHQLSAIDLYILAMSILFHDAGNLHGRGGHELNIDQIFDWARGDAAGTRREKTLVLTAVRAHSGQTASGSRDTLRDVPSIDHINSQQVQLCQIAALLRMADELAEGPHRTSEFFRLHVGFDEGSKIYHRYASCTHVSADRGNERIRLTYEIQLKEFATGTQASRKRALATFLDFVFRRIMKLDDERRYTRFYCPVLSKFKQTDVAINFHHGSPPVQPAVRFQLDDLVVPGHSDHQLSDRFPDKCGSPKAIAAEAISNTAPKRRST